MSEDTQKPLPVLLVKPGTVSKEDIARAETLGFICIIECTEPEVSRFVEPPIMANIDEQARAAMRLMRYIVYETNAPTLDRDGLVRLLVKALLDGHQPAPVTRPKKA